MSTVIDTAFSATKVVGSLADVTSVGATEGVYHGETVLLEPDLSSQLEDLVEEIGMAVAYRGDRRLLERRKIRAGRGLDEADSSRLSRYRRDLPQLPGVSALQRLFDSVLTLYQEPLDHNDDQDDNAELRGRIIAELESYDPDVTHQYVALGLLLSHLTRHEASSRLRNALRDVQAEFGRGYVGRDVRAGFAAALPAAEAASALKVEPGIIRSTYRTMIADARNMAELFQLLRKFDLAERFSSVVATFIKAAARDLASTGPSTDPGYIRALLVELNRLAKAKSVVLMACDLMHRTDRHLRDGEKASGGAMDVAGRVLGFACKSDPAPEDAYTLMEPYAHTQLSAQLVYANGLRELHGELPIDIAPSPQAHLNQNAAILEMLEALVEVEENEYRST